MSAINLLAGSPTGKRMTAEVWEAIQHKFLDCVKGANQKDEPDWMHAATLLYEYPRLINVQPRGRWSALHQAVFMANSDAVRFFLRFGADPNLCTCHENQDPMTPKQLAEALRDQDKHLNPPIQELRSNEGSSNDEPEGTGSPSQPKTIVLGKILERNKWPQSESERAKLYDEIIELLSGTNIKQRHEAIAHSYIVAMSAGDLSEDAKEELRDQWHFLDPTMSLIEDVVKKINEHYDKTMDVFIHKLDFGIFPTVVQLLHLSAPVRWFLSFAGHSDAPPKFGALICWPFRVCDQDVRHALDDLIPPETVNLPKLTSVLAHLLPIWDGAETRLAFQTLAWKRSWSRGRDIRSMSLADIAAWIPLSLYGTIIFCALFSYFAGIYTVYEALNTVYTLVFGSGFRDKLCSTLWLGVVVWLGDVGRAYCDAMQPRIPMLTVRLHRALILKGSLEDTDYTSRKDFNIPYVDFRSGGDCKRDRDREESEADVSNQNDVAANPSNTSWDEAQIQKGPSDEHLRRRALPCRP